MSNEVLKYIKDQLTNAGINYEFDEWTQDLVYPYFTGEYTENDTNQEDGQHEIDFILNGFSRGKGARLALENARETIEQLFTFNTSILANGSGIDVSYSGSFPIQTGDSELKRMQINLKIKEWKVS